VLFWRGGPLCFWLGVVNVQLPVVLVFVSCCSSLKQYSDAASMYSKAEQFDKAAGILILTKNFAAVAPLLDKITLPKLHAQYAKVGSWLLKTECKRYRLYL
jgi:hypothetical protein